MRFCDSRWGRLPGSSTKRITSAVLGGAFLPVEPTKKMKEAYLVDPLLEGRTAKKLSKKLFSGTAPEKHSNRIVRIGFIVELIPDNAPPEIWKIDF